MRVSDNVLTLSSRASFLSCLCFANSASLRKSVALALFFGGTALFFIFTFAPGSARVERPGSVDGESNRSLE